MSLCTGTSRYIAPLTLYRQPGQQRKTESLFGILITWDPTYLSIAHNWNLPTASPDQLAP